MYICIYTKNTDWTVKHNLLLFINHSDLQNTLCQTCTDNKNLRVHRKRCRKRLTCRSSMLDFS